MAKASFKNPNPARNRQYTYGKPISSSKICRTLLSGMLVLFQEQNYTVEIIEICAATIRPGDA
jgi:hypothetical protein